MLFVLAFPKVYATIQEFDRFVLGVIFFCCVMQLRIYLFPEHTNFSLFSHNSVIDLYARRHSYTRSADIRVQEMSQRYGIDLRQCLPLSLCEAPLWCLPQVDCRLDLSTLTRDDASELIVQ